MIEIVWIGSSRKDLRTFPEDVTDEFGFALYCVQMGSRPVAAKVLKGFGGAGVLELIAGHESGTYRVVYTITLTGRVYVLHCFQKKSKSGISHPKQDIDLIKARLRSAQELHKLWLETRKPEDSHRSGDH